MSASSKKKLRKEMAAQQLTERQQREIKEAKKLKRLTVSFFLIMLAIVLTTTSVLTVRHINHIGYYEKRTTAVTIDGTALNTVQMNYYLRDTIQNAYSQWQNSFGENTNTYLGLLYGLNVNAPLDEQKHPSYDGTWGQYFLDQAMLKAKNDYALYNKAMAEGYKLPEKDQQYLDSSLSTMSLYASFYGKNVDQYLRDIYGYGSTEETYKQYMQITTIASNFYNEYSKALTYTDEQLRAHEKDKEIDYTSFTYATYTLSMNSFLKGGTKDENGAISYTAAEEEAALKEAKAIADKLLENTNLEALDKAIGALEINKENTSAKTTLNTQVLYTNIPEAYKTWLSASERQNNEMTVIESKTTNEDGTSTVTGYTVLVFQERDENMQKLANVRHLLVAFEGGTTGLDGKKTYTDAEKKTAKTEAERLLQLWKNGAMTEDSFVALVKEHTDDGSKETGGLYEEIHRKSNYVENFLNWSISTDRKVGDTDIIETEYGYHIMYFSSYDELTYRDYMIRENLRSADVEKWYNAIVEPCVATLVSKKRLNTDFILASLSSSY